MSTMEAELYWCPYSVQIHTTKVLNGVPIIFGKTEYHAFAHTVELYIERALRDLSLRVSVDHAHCTDPEYVLHYPHGLYASPTVNGTA